LLLLAGGRGVDSDLSAKRAFGKGRTAHSQKKRLRVNGRARAQTESGKARQKQRAEGLSLVGSQEQGTHLAGVTDGHIRHELHAAGHDHIVSIGGNETHSRGDGL